MEEVDKIDDLNDLIIAILARLEKSNSNKDLLIREAFALWYVLVEGVECINFSEEEIGCFLRKNYSVFKKIYTHDADYNFIMGWMINISSWYFDSSLDESYGRQLLHTAYKGNPNNKLFKWAIRDQLGLRQAEIISLEKDIIETLNQYYDHGSQIRNYLLDIIPPRDIV